MSELFWIYLVDLLRGINSADYPDEGLDFVSMLVTSVTSSDVGLYDASLKWVRLATELVLGCCG